MAFPKVSNYLSELLGLPESLVLNDDGSLSSLCLNELNSVIEMPVGFTLTKEIRIPKYGEYFMDIESLVDKDRITVYKAVGSLPDPGLILHNGATSHLEDPVSPQFGEGDLKTQTLTPHLIPTTENGFDWMLCRLQGGCAVYKGKKIELLSNYVDPEGLVGGVMMHDKKLVLVKASELKNLPPANGGNSPLSGPLDLMAGVVDSLLAMQQSQKKKHDDEKKDRMKYKFDGPRPDLDDLLNDVF